MSHDAQLRGHAIEVWRSQGIRDPEILRLLRRLDDAEIRELLERSSRSSSLSSAE